MKDTILQEAQALAPEMIAHRRYLHGHAETGFDTAQTLAYVRDALMEMGYQPECCGKAGLTAMVGKGPGKVFLLRADMDALPIREETELPFACPDGRMHACGHDMHTAMLLMAAKILKKYEDRLPGQVKLMFQSAEEPLEGAEDMIAAGVLENPSVDAGAMIHVATGVQIPAGTVLISPPGVTAPAADPFTITVRGKGCHGSMPQEGIDSLTAAAHILIALQEIQARELGIGDRGVMTIGTFHGGSTANVIADSAVMSGTIRSFDEKTQQHIKDRIVTISRCVAEAFRAQAEVTFGSGTPPLRNDPGLCRLAEDAMEDLLGNYAIAVSKLPGDRPASGGSEDFAFISRRIPTVMLSLAAGEPDRGYTYPLHHPKTKFDESAMANGTAALVWLAFQFLES